MHIACFAELYLTRAVPVLPSPLTPLEFYRSYVTPNKPVVINGVIDKWPALTKWTNQHLKYVTG